MNTSPPDIGKALLSDVTAIDLADEKGSFCSKLLADLGARVIKLEKPGGDPSRFKEPYYRDKPDPRRSLHFWYHNTNKLGITLDIETAKGRDLFLRLARSTDVIIETYQPGYLTGISLDYEILRKINPGIILASITGFGQTGPHNQYKSCDIVASACGGQMFVSGNRDAPPLLAYGEQSYYTASLFGTVGILVALHARRYTGKGQQIDISLQEAVAATLEHVMVRHFYDKVVPQRQGDLHWNKTSTILQCKDGYILVTFEREWETLVEWLDSDGMADDLKEQKWLEGDYRKENVEHVIEVLANWAKVHTVSELFETSQLMRFPWAPVQNIQELLADQQLKDSGFFVPVNHHELDTSFLYPGIPFKLSTIPHVATSRAPDIGEHNRQIYHEELGLSLGEMDELSSQHII